MNMKPLISLALALAALSGGAAHAAVNVLACEPEWAALAQELGGAKVNATSATTALQDPHRIEARPGLIARTRNADLLVCTGLELESGWLPLLVQQSGNPKIVPGQPGYFEAGSYVLRIGVPSSVDRAQGDVHSSGNPHIQMNPHNIQKVAVALARRLGEIDPANATHYQARLADFTARWSAATAKWEKQAAPLRGVAVVEHHKDLEYLIAWLGMRGVGTLEPRPGIEPSAAQLGELLRKLKQQPAKLVVRSAYQDARASNWLAERAGIPVVALPFTVGADKSSTTLFSLYDSTIARLLEANK